MMETAKIYAEQLRFYCQYYDEIQPHITSYRVAKTPQERGLANTAYRKWENTISYTTPIKNYTLELVSVEKKYYYIWGMLLAALTACLGYYIALQLLRIAYQYVTIGKFTWHPYRLPK
jgi:hypothetical protein